MQLYFEQYFSTTNKNERFVYVGQVMLFLSFIVSMAILKYICSYRSIKT